jgi:hypothetical protein
VRGGRAALIRGDREGFGSVGGFFGFLWKLRVFFNEVTEKVLVQLGVSLAFSGSFVFFLKYSEDTIQRRQSMHLHHGGMIILK